VAAALQRIVPPDVPTTPMAVEAYPSLWERRAGNSHEQRANRAVETSSLWNLHVTGARREG
jgi:hypothetical protein